MKGTEVPNLRCSSAFVSCPDYFSPSGSEKYGLGTRLAVHVIVLVCEVMRLDHTFWPFRDSFMLHSVLFLPMQSSLTSF